MIKTKNGYYTVIYALFTSAFFYLIFPYFAGYGNIFFSERSLLGSYFVYPGSYSVYADSNGSCEERIFHNYDLLSENGVCVKSCDFSDRNDVCAEGYNFYDENDRYNKYSDCSLNISDICDYEESCCNFSLDSVKISFTANGKAFVFSPDYGKMYETDKSKRLTDGTLSEKLALMEEITLLGFSREIAVDYVFCGYSGFVDGLEKKLNVPAEDACVSFTKRQDCWKKNISKEKQGSVIDRAALADLTYISLLYGKNESIKIPMTKVKPSVTAKMLEKSTFLRAEFSTYCNVANTNRVHNIKLALSKLDGLVIASGESFSFNSVVGERSEGNGFLPATVINKGEYVDGIGGGVCQVSTTLYNAALMADVTVIERHRHTFKSSYVMAGFDAMVTYGGADLRLKNDTGGNLYLLCDYDGGRITVAFFGVKNPSRITLRSVIEEDYGNGSVKSSSYADYFKGDILAESKRLHGDYYYPDKGEKSTPEKENQ